MELRAAPATGALDARASSAPSPPRRLAWLDLARGSAVVAMALYHFGWDLSFYRLIETDVGRDPAWQWAARLIAGSFLLIAGVGLVLGHGTVFRPAAFFKRLAVIGSAALAVTASTLFAFPESYIFFGILHCIALSSLLALPFLRAPASVTLTAALACFTAPFVLTQPALDGGLLDALGLGSRVPVTNDYVPLLPWFGVALAGVLLGRHGVPALQRGALGRLAPRSTLGRGLAWAGRHSLPIYLVHQPVLLALLYPVALALGPAPKAQASAFLRAFQESCRGTGADEELCASTERCLVGRLQAEDLWAPAIAGAVDEKQAARVQALARACFREARPETGP